MGSHDNEDDDDGPPQGVIVCVRLRPMFVTRPDGTAGREANCKRCVEMEGKAAKGVGCAVTKIYDPNDMSAKPREYAFDRSYWSSDGFIEDPQNPGVNIPDGPDSKYVSQDMVWNDIGHILMKNILNGYNVTVFAYGQSGAGKSYSVLGYPPNNGIIPHAMTDLFAVVDRNQDPNVRYQVEIAMLEVYMDEVYDLLEPRKKERQKLNVFINKGEVFVYDPKDRKNIDKIWRAARNYEQAEAFRRLGDANRSVRSTGMNPVSSRGHSIFIMRFRKEAKNGEAWMEQMRSKVSLVDLAGSERAHDTGLTGIGLEEGIAINKSLSALGQVLVNLCKGEKVIYRDKLTQLLAESLGGTAVTVMIAALSPADINYADTVSTLRFADNAKKMPVKAIKQLDPTARLIADLKEENQKLQAQLAGLGGSDAAQQTINEKKAYEDKLEDAENKLKEMEKAYQAMEAKVQKGGRLRIAALPFKVQDKSKLDLLDGEIARLREELADAANSKEAADAKRLELEEALERRAKAEEEANQAAQETQKAAKIELEVKAAQMEELKQESDNRANKLADELSMLRSVVQQLAEQGQEAKEERSKLAELIKERETEEEQRRYAASEEKSAVETLLEARLLEIEQLVRELDTARHDHMMAKHDASADVGEKEQLVQHIEEALRAARADYQAMESKADVVGAGCRFRAAALAVDQQEQESRLRAEHEEVEWLRAEVEQNPDSPMAQQAQHELEQHVIAEKEALREAARAAEEARAAAEAALAERMTELQEVIKERDRASAEAMEAQERLEPSKAEIQDRQAAIEAILEYEQESWEEKLKDSEESQKQLQQSFEDMGLSVAEIVQLGRGAAGGSTGQTPHFVNLCEDAHDDGLIYLIPEGVSKVTRYDEGNVDAAPGIKLCGSSIKPYHALLNFDAATHQLTIQRGDVDALVHVNGDQVIDDHVLLQHGARVIFGNDFVFRYVDPRQKRTKRSEAQRQTLVDWQFCMNELSEKHGCKVEQELSDMRNKFQEQIAKREAELNEEQRLLEERMARERQQFEKEIRELQQKAGGTLETVHTRETQQERTQATLAQFQSRISAKRSRAQWVRAALMTSKNARFELDVRHSRKQMFELQPRITEANRIAALHVKGVSYAFHFLDAIDPRPQGGSMFDGAGSLAEFVGSKALGATAAVIGTASLSSNDDDDEALLPKRLLLQIKVEKTRTGEVQLWPQQKFMDRFTRMLAYTNGEGLDTFFDEEDARYEDIFWDEMDHTLMGSAATGLTPLLALSNVRESVTLRGPSGDVRGALTITLSMQLASSTQSHIGNLAGIAGMKPDWDDLAGQAKQLRGKEVKGEVRFGRLTNVEDKWAGLFVRFSWFNTHGRLENESPVVEGTSLGHAFKFEQTCTDAFLHFIESGVMIVQVRAYERGKVKDIELRDLRLKLRRAEAELAALRGKPVPAIDLAPVELATGKASSSKPEALQSELWKAHQEKDKAKLELQAVRRELELARHQLQVQQQQGGFSKVIPGAHAGMSESSALRKRVDELEAQLRNVQDASKKPSKVCVLL